MTLPENQRIAPELLEVIDSYRVCEFATLSRSATPIVWPTAVLRRPDGTFLITTSIAFPQKAFNIRRDPRVALLFSDPTGSGLNRAPQVLVQGTAICPDEIVTGTAGLEEYWRRIYARQPAAGRYSASPVARWAFDWYFMRLVITVVPTVISTRDPQLAIPKTPAPPAAGSAGVVGAAAAALAEYSSAVLGGRDTDGAPRLLRVRPVPDAAARAFTLNLPDAEPLVPGPASLLCHSHDEQLLNLRSVVIVGELARGGDTLRFSPCRMVPGLGADGPIAMLRAVRRWRRTAHRYLQHRGLPRPRVPWEQYEALSAATDVKRG